MPALQIGWWVDFGNFKEIFFPEDVPLVYLLLEITLKYSPFFQQHFCDPSEEGGGGGGGKRSEVQGSFCSGVGNPIKPPALSICITLCRWPSLKCVYVYVYVYVRACVRVCVCVCYL